MRNEILNKTKVILITGGTRGVGFGIMEKFCQSKEFHKYFIAFTSTKLEEGTKVKKSLIKLYPHMKENLENYELDLTSNTSIQTQAKTFLQNCDGRIDVLYNNAGCLIRNPPIEKKGRENIFNTVFAINYLGLKKLTEEYLPSLLRSKNGHIINLSSELGRSKFKDNKITKRFVDPELKISDLDVLLKEYKESFINNNLLETGWHDYNPHYGCYGVSKVFVNAYTRILHRDLKKHYNAAHLKSML